MRHCRQLARRAISGDEDGMIRQSNDNTIFQYPRRRVLNRKARILIHDAEDGIKRLSDGGVERPSREPLSDGVHVANAPFGVSRDDGIPDAGEGRTESLLLLGQDLFSGSARDFEFEVFSLALEPLLGAPHRLEHSDRGNADDAVNGETNLVLDLIDGERVAGMKKEEGRGEPPNDHRHHGRSAAAEPSRENDGSVQRDKGESIVQYRIK